MASMASVAEFRLPPMRLSRRLAPSSAHKPTRISTWRTIADTASGMVFLAALGWQIWRVSGQLWELSIRAVAAGGGYLF